MAISLSQFVVSDGNREAYELVKSVTKPQPKPVRAFIIGPAGSGKTALVRARWNDRDLLSPKKSTYIQCCEVAKIIRSVSEGLFPEESGMEEFITNLGTNDVLFLDDFEGWWEDSEMGTEAGRLLISARNMAGLDTIITSTKPMNCFDLDAFAGALNGFEEIYLARYDEADLADFVKAQQEMFSTEKSPVLGEDAIDYIAYGMGESPERISRIVEFFMTQIEDIEPGSVLDKEYIVRATS